MFPRSLNDRVAQSKSLELTAEIPWFCWDGIGQRSQPLAAPLRSLESDRAAAIESSGPMPDSLARVFAKLM